MFTRAKKKQKIADETLYVLATVFPNLVPFLGVNDLTNLSLLCKGLHSAVEVARAGPWKLVKEERRPTMIAFQKKKIDEELGPDFSLEDVTVSQVQSFRFWVSQDCHPHKMEVFVHVENELWEEIDNQKVRDLQVPTGMSIFMHAHDETPDSMGDLVFSSTHDFAPNDIFVPSMGGRYGFHFHRFQEIGLEEHKNELRRILSILYACTKRISSWYEEGDACAYPSAEYLMRLLPDPVWPFFPEDFDWEKDHSDRTTVPEFSYHAAPDMEDWFSVTPTYLEDGRYSWRVSSIPWYS